MTDEPTATPAPKKRMSRAAIIASVAAGVGGVAAACTIIVLAIAANTGPDFEAAVVDDCGLKVGVDARVLDNGDGLLLNGVGEESSGLELASTMCILTALDVPDTTLTRMEQTRSMDGRQRDELDGYAIEWTYHPDDGLDVLLSK